MDDDPKHKIRGYRQFKKWPTGRQALIVGALFAALLLIGLIMQSAGIWPDSWNTTFDGTGE